MKKISNVNKSSFMAFSGGVIIAILGIGARISIGNVYGEAEALKLISSLANAGLYLGSAIATASVTTLALMLALLGLTRRSDNDFDNQVYERVSRIATYATVTLIGSIMLLLMLVMPVGEFDTLPDRWYPTYYNVLFALVVGVSALITTTILQLFFTIRSVIAAITPSESV